MTVCTRGWRALVEGAALGLEMPLGRDQPTRPKS